MPSTLRDGGHRRTWHVLIPAFKELAAAQRGGKAEELHKESFRSLSPNQRWWTGDSGTKSISEDTVSLERTGFVKSGGKEREVPGNSKVLIKATRRMEFALTD